MYIRFLTFCYVKSVQHNEQAMDNAKFPSVKLRDSVSMYRIMVGGASKFEVKHRGVCLK